MRFDLVDLQLFIAIAESHSITGGAVRANLALASASARIGGLEQDLGVALLIRGRRGVTLTAAGECLLGHARVVSHNIDAMRGDLADYARGVKASVHLLANTAGLSEHLPMTLAAFLADHPQIDIDMDERESSDIATAIAAGAADIGIAVDAVLPAGLARFAFCDDRLVLAISEHDELANRRQIGLSELTRRDFVGLASGSALQMHLAAQTARLGTRLKFRARLKDFDAVCGMVAAGIGIAIVPEVTARRCARSMAIRIVKLRDPWAMRQLVVCTRADQSLSRPAQLLLAHLRRAARS